MDKSREELEKEYAEATAKLEQYQHRGQRYENRIRYYTQGERKKRNHRLITRGGAVESIAPEVRGMSERAFFLLMEKVFSLPEVAALIHRTTDPQEDGYLALFHLHVTQAQTERGTVCCHVRRLPSRGEIV